jgi:hypothetical protein
MALYRKIIRLQKPNFMQGGFTAPQDGPQNERFHLGSD